MTDGTKGRGKKQIKRLKLKKETLRDLDARRTARKVKGGEIIELSHMQSCVPIAGCTDSCGCTVGCTHTCLFSCPCRK